MKKMNNMMKKISATVLVKGALLFSLFTFSPLSASAQCGIENTAFKSGEFLSYDLYFNWKFVWVKVGTASMSTVQTKYKGQNAFRSSLVTRGNSQLDNVFMMRDTLLCYTDMDISPLYFRKGAREGDRYYVDELWYSYPNTNCHLKMHRIDADGEVHWKEAEYKDCIYDMMSIFMRARNFDASKLKVGENIPMPISDAKSLSNSWLKYTGKTTLKMKNNNDKYRCLVFSFIEREDGKNHELIRFYITDDKNHMPVRLDMFLSFGSAKAYLSGFKGLRNPLESTNRMSTSTSCPKVTFISIVAKSSCCPSVALWVISSSPSTDSALPCANRSVMVFLQKRHSASGTVLVVWPVRWAPSCTNRRRTISRQDGLRPLTSSATKARQRKSILSLSASISCALSTIITSVPIVRSGPFTMFP